MKLLYRLLCFSYVLQRWLKRRFTVTGLGIICCLMVAAIVGLDTKQTTAYQIFTLLLAIAIVAMLYSLRFRFSCHVTGVLPRFATVGVKLRYSLTIYNQTGKIQRGLKLLENFADPRPSFTEFKQILESSTQKKGFTSIYYLWLQAIARNRKAQIQIVHIPTLLPRSTTKVTVEITPSHRGLMRLSGVTIARADPFNIFHAFKTIAKARSLLVLPQRYQIPQIYLAGSRNFQSGNVSLTSSVGDSEEFMSLRDYRPGDSLRKIHWKSWAKTDKPVVKEEQEEFFVRHGLILDTFGVDPHSEILEEAISVAASFACDFRTQESLLDLMFVGLEAYCFTSGRGLGNTEKMLEILAGVVPCRHRPFEYLTQIVMSRVSLLSGCICILIAWDEERQKLVDYLQQLGIPVLVLLIGNRSNYTYSQHARYLHLLELGKIQETLLNVRQE